MAEGAPQFLPAPLHPHPSPSPLHLCYQSFNVCVLAASAQVGDLRPYIEKALSDFDTVILDSEILLVDDVGCMRSHTHIHCCCDASCSGTVFECLSSTGFSVHSAVYAFPSFVAPRLPRNADGELASLRLLRRQQAQGLHARHRVPVCVRCM